MDRLSADAQACAVTARYADGSLQTYHWGYDPMARGGQRSGLKRRIDSRWIDLPMA
jgi:hypothetical protein